MAFLQHLRACGLRLAAAGNQLLVEPRSALTDELRALIRSNKPAILQELTAELPDPIEDRRKRVEERLRTRPEHRLAFDVAEAPVKAGPGEPISVVLALRHADHILSGELRIPRERFDAALFLSIIETSGRPS